MVEKSYKLSEIEGVWGWGGGGPGRDRETTRGTTRHRRVTWWVAPCSGNQKSFGSFQGVCQKCLEFNVMCQSDVSCCSGKCTDQGTGHRQCEPSAKERRKIERDEEKVNKILVNQLKRRVIAGEKPLKLWRRKKKLWNIFDLAWNLENLRSSCACIWQVFVCYLKNVRQFEEMMVRVSSLCVCAFF